MTNETVNNSNSIEQTNQTQTPDPQTPVENQTEQTPAEKTEPVAAIETETETKAEELPVEKTEPIGQTETEELPVEDTPTLLDNLEQLANHENFEQVRNDFSVLKAQLQTLFSKENKINLGIHLENGGTKEDYKPAANALFDRFRAISGVVLQRRNAVKQEDEQQKQSNLKEKQLVLTALKTLVDDSDDNKETYNAFKKLQQNFLKIGNAPNPQNSEIWRTYNIFTEKFYSNLRINRELKELDMKHNFDAKTVLCERAERLVNETSLKESTNGINVLHQEWKAIGPVPEDKKTDLWERFTTTTNLIYDKRREHYEQMEDGRKEKIEAKQALCQEAEGLVTEEPKNHKQWEKLTERFIKIQTDWKTIGFVSKDQDEELWQRFKAACDAFFNNKKDHYKHIKDLEDDNIRLKTDMCVRAEALAESVEWKQTTEEVIQLQKEWKTIGAVPYKVGEKLWKRFRAACDAFFKNKEAHFGNREGAETENLAAKEALINTIESFEFTDDETANHETLKGLQKQWSEIGFVPLKLKKEIQERYIAAIDQKFDDLRASRKNKSMTNFKTHIDKVKTTDNSNQVLRRENAQIVSRINKIKEEADLLENNIGFFAQSKNADTLRKEVEKKVAELKKQIAELEEKRYLLAD